MANQNTSLAKGTWTEENNKLYPQISIQKFL